MAYTHKHTHTHTHTHTMEYYSAIKKEQDFAICNNMDGLEGYYAKWNKSENNIMHDITYIWKLKKKSSKYSKKKQTHRYREQASGYQWGEGWGRGKRQVGD